ncbi:MAG: 4a-hydroxytetrahydrobiopterin dehydratase [Kiloniellaceae bacterium]
MAQTALSQKTCTPCRGGIAPLSPAEVAGLLPQAPGWAAVDGDTKIEARFAFDNFRMALDFVRQVGELAEAEFHHPLFINFGWGFADIVLQTKKIKGLHENDFIMAAKISEIAEAVSGGAAD